MKLSTTFEKTFRKVDGTIQNQELVIWAQANSKQEAEELNYDDFKMDLYIDGKYIADISYVLAKTNAFDTLIESEDWAKLYADNAEEQESTTYYFHNQIKRL